ncbi:hypothetical protein EB796_012937 [Bugula neritina]|uniref:Uncharacterized protein n=1 Tax=Bugula neritina TaxID=10212 RepID=A0A7J7JS13_BUGNE|nr:hypothetical protein EB796_012937 [Bugula neritina]
MPPIVISKDAKKAGKAKAARTGDKKKEFYCLNFFMITSTSICLPKLFQKVPRKQERLKQPALVIFMALVALEKVSLVR